MHHMPGLPRILISGTGRSGTSILAALFSLHPDTLYFPEPQIWMQGQGLPAVARGEITPEQYGQVLIEQYRRKLVYWLTEHGHEGADEVYSARHILATLQWAFSQPGSRLEQAARFVDGFFSLGLQRWGGRTWVEKTPRTMIYVDLLDRMFPQMRYLHIIREPKDIYCSVRGRPWGPNTIVEFIHWYNVNMHKAWQAQLTLDENRYMTLSMEQLIRHPRHVARAALAFTGLDEAGDVIERFVERVNVGRSHTGRWREELGTDDVRAIDQQCSSLYRRWLLKAENDFASRAVLPFAVAAPR